MCDYDLYCVLICVNALVLILMKIVSIQLFTLSGLS